jgi:hypothetical protein
LRSPSWLGFVAAVVGVAVLALLGAGPVSAQGSGAGTASSWPVDNLGQPVQRALSTSTALGVTSSGDPQAYFLNMGNYSDAFSEFVAVDLLTDKTVFDSRLPSGYANDGMAFSAADGAVFMANGGSDVFEYQLGGSSVQDLGPAISGQTIWTLAAGPDGTLWGGTYPGGDIFSYDPATKAYHDYGQALAGETYITSLDPAGSTVYFGTQPDTDLGELDPSTGQVTQIPLPAAYAGEAGDVDGISLRGSRLIVAVAADTGFTGALVWDVPSQSWVQTIANFSGGVVSPVDPSNPNDVYFRISSGSIVRYDLETLSMQTLNWAPNAIPGAWEWADLDDSTDFPGQTLMFTYYTSDRIYGYNLTSDKGYYLQPAVQGSGDQLIALGEGPDGDVYAGAYLTPPGMGQWSPATDSWQVLSGSGQVEGYGSYDGNLVFGRYPEGDLYYDVLSEPWGSGNPSPAVAIGDNQNRPVAFTQVGDVEAVGSVPVSGRLGGDISLWNPATGAISVFSDVVADQTPVSLVNSGGLIWGGTSIDGGYGINPTATSGELFAWDPTTHQVVFSTVPLQGATNVSGLVLDGQGHLWGLADSTLFEFDLATRTVIRTEALASTRDDSMYGLENQLVLDHGRLFATTDGRLFHIDTVTWSVQTLYAGPASNLTEDGQGQLFFIQDPSYVYRYDLPTTVYTPAVTAHLVRTPVVSVVSLRASEPGGVGIGEVDYQVGNGAWHVYRHPFVVGGRQTVSYRAVDRAWSASPVETVVTGPDA